MTPNRTYGTALSLDTIRDKARAILAVEDNGSTMVEFGFILPPLLLVATGIMVLGVALNNYIMLNNATNIGARAISISRGQTTDPCQTASSIILAAAPTMNPSSFSFTYSFSGSTYTGTSCNIQNTTAVNNLVQGKPVVVTVTYPCALGMYGRKFATACYLTAQVTELAQ